MNRPNATVVESNIPAAVESRDFKGGLTVKQQREQEDITAWLEMQEEAELDLLREGLSHTRRGMRFLSDEMSF